jgi:hypothetical protein
MANRVLRLFRSVVDLLLEQLKTFGQSWLVRARPDFPGWSVGVETSLDAARKSECATIR